MEEITADDDLLSCMLVDSLEFEPDIVTHKMNPAFRPMRFDRHAVTKIVQQNVIWEQNVSKGMAKFCEYVLPPILTIQTSYCSQAHVLENASSETSI